MIDAKYLEIAQLNEKIIFDLVQPNIKQVQQLILPIYCMNELVFYVPVSAILGYIGTTIS
jgi:uncharacterized protein (UPF0297 family)